MCVPAFYICSDFLGGQIPNEGPICILIHAVSKCTSCKRIPPAEGSEEPLLTVLLFSMLVSDDGS